MKVFGTDSTAVGCFVRFDIDLNKAGGAVLHMPALNAKAPSLGGSSKELISSAYLPYVITDIQTESKENLAIQKCFEYRAYTYAFGPDVESVVINVVSFLTGGSAGPKPWSTDPRKVSNQAGKVASKAFSTMRQMYEEGRISSSKSFGSLSFNGGELTNLMLVGNTGGVYNLQANIYSFQLRFLILPRPLVVKTGN